MNDTELLDGPPSNTAGNIGAVLSVIALVVVIGALVLVQFVAAEYIPDREYSSHNPRIITDKIGNTMNVFGQLVLFVVGGLVGGTLAVVGFIVSAIGLKQYPNRSAKIGLFSSLAAGGLLWAFVALKRL